LSRYNGGDNIQKFLLFTEDNNEREKSLVEKHQSELRGKFITVPDDEENKKKGRQ
jgi:hypothetical protein